MDYFDLLSFTAHVSCLILLLNVKQAPYANLYTEVVWSSLNNCEDTSKGGIQGRVINFLPAKKRRVSIKCDTTKRGVTINFTASQGRVTFLKKKYKGRAGRFYIHAHSGLSSPRSLQKKKCSLKWFYLIPSWNIFSLLLSVWSNWPHVRSNLVPGLMYNYLIVKNYLQAWFWIVYPLKEFNQQNGFIP